MRTKLKLCLVSFCSRKNKKKTETINNDSEVFVKGSNNSPEMYQNNCSNKSHLCIRT